MDWVMSEFAIAFMMGEKWFIRPVDAISSTLKDRAR
jgi:hypothetical protein